MRNLVASTVLACSVIGSAKAAEVSTAVYKSGVGGGVLINGQIIEVDVRRSRKADAPSTTVPAAGWHVTLERKTCTETKVILTVRVTEVLRAVAA